MNIKREELDLSLLTSADGAAIEWRILPGLTEYETTLKMMDKLVAEIHLGNAPETVLLVEHPPVYTGGTSAKPSDLINPDGFPVFQTGRGGEYTYHGPGQRIAYVMLDLSKRNSDVRAFIGALEAWIISTLDEFNIVGERREDRVGVWVKRPEKPKISPNLAREDKIAAIGIRLRKWISLHGISINVEPDLTHYDGIIPCGIKGYGVTSLVDLGLPVTMEDLDVALKKRFQVHFGNLK